MKSNPFDLRVLAVFLYRAINRKKHAGRLDMDSKSPGNVVIHFHNLYAPHIREDLISDLTRMFGLVVKLPVVREGAPDLPEEVREVILRGWILERKNKECKKLMR